MASPDGSRSRRLFWIVLSVLSVVIVAGVAGTVLVRRAGTGVDMIRVAPVRIEIYEDGRIEVVTKAIKPAGRDEVGGRLPMEVPVFTIASDGTRTPGVVIANTTNKPQDTIYFANPLAVVHGGRGVYSVETQRAGYEITDGMFPPGFIKQVPGSEDVRVRYEPEPSEQGGH